MKKVLFIFLILIFLASVGIIGAVNWYESAINTPVSDNETLVEFEILPGESIDEIKEKLFASGFINNKFAFDIYIKLNHDKGANIQAGLFDLRRSNNLVEVLDILQKARNKEDIKITIPEGLRYDEIADIFEKAFKDKNQTFKKDEFIAIVEKPWEYNFSQDASSKLQSYKPENKNLEGFLYPDTYYFSKEASAQNVIEKLILELFNKLDGDDYSALGISERQYTFYDRLIIASIIEREAATTEEMPMIADVLYKRLEHGVEGVKLLQVCPSVLYFVKDWKADVARYWHIDNPYNTYIHPGLTPTPISNPGIKAIKAAIFPTKNDYYFYMHGKDGVIHYGKNLAEHNDNIRKYM